MGRRPMKSRRTILVVGALLLLVAAAGMALYLSNRRNVTTSSSAAYEAYREGLENEHRFYKKEARVAYARALSLDPQFAMALLGLARMTPQDQRASLLERAERLKPRLNEQERMQVDLHAAEFSGRRQDADRIAERLHEKYPDDIPAAMALAHLRFGEGKPNDALHVLAEVLAVEPNNAEAYNLIGYFYGWRGEYEKAIENLKRYQFMAPDQANPLDSLGEIQAYSGHYDEAIQNLNRALAIKPDFYESYGHLAVAEEGKGNIARAIDYDLKATQEALNDDIRRRFLLNALRLAVDAGDLPRSRELGARLAALPRTKEYELGKSWVLAHLALVEGRPAEAERILIELKPRLDAYLKTVAGYQDKPYAPGWHWSAAKAKIAQGKTDEALALYREMLNPPTPWTNFEDRTWVYVGRAAVAEILASRGDVESAEKLLEENRKWNPSWAPTRAAELAVAQRRREKVLAAAK
jgi:tetratricopeptide (TPR) repeat protein